MTKKTYDPEGPVAVGDELYGGLIVSELDGMRVTVEVPEGCKLQGTDVLPANAGELNTETGVLSMAQAETLKARKWQADQGIPTHLQSNTAPPGPVPAGVVEHVPAPPQTAEEMAEQDKANHPDDDDSSKKSKKK